jgi:hypothetical protein
MPSSDTRAVTIPLFFPPAMPPYTGQCLHMGSVLDGYFVLVMTLYYSYIKYGTGNYSKFGLAMNY